MELKFIWVKSYRILNEIGINFNHSGEHKFDYVGNAIQLIDNKKSILDFGENITGVTALAGQNGSGKSSICEIVLYSTATLVNGSMGYNYPFDGIVCYGDHVFYHKDLQISNLDELKAAGYTTIVFEKTPFESMKPEWNKTFTKGGFIYYSNIIDWRSDIDGVNLANISTQALLNYDICRTDYGIYNTFGIRYSDEYKFNERLNLLDAFNQTEGFRNINFYLNFPDFIPFGSTISFNLKSTSSYNNRFLHYYKLTNYDDVKYLLDYESQILDSIHIETINDKPGTFFNTDKQRLVLSANYLYRFNLIIAEALEQKKWPDKAKTYDFIFNNNPAFDFFSAPNQIDELLKLHKLLLEKGEFIEGYDIETLKYHHAVNDSKWRFYVIESLYLLNSDEIRIILKQFIDLENLVLNKDNHTVVRISNYQLMPQKSSGENSFYSFFARLYDTIKRYDNGIDDRNSLILFIDEGEVGFHPEWKKKYFKWVLDFLTTNFSHYKFQIILTTHSPYLLSDLPSENVLLISKGRDSLTEIVPDNRYSTFGSNIHSILSDNFFLKDGTIGEFAKNEIQKVINNLNRWKKLSSDEILAFIATDKGLIERDRTYEIINLIGDNIVRNKLFEMYYDVFEGNDTIDKEISSLTKKIEDLKKRKK